MKSVEDKIYDKIKKAKRGVIYFPEDFEDFGSHEAVRLALHRLVKKEVIVRVAQGIYVRPKTSGLLGALLPTAEEVAVALAKRDRIKTLPTGSYALNALGLSTQVPMKIVFLTDGSSRTVKVGNRTIKFKKTTAKNLQAKGDMSRLVIQALKEIGKDNQTLEEEKRITSLLKKEDINNLLFDIKLAPVWIKKIMKKALV
jgi:hypothetical protein